MIPVEQFMSLALGLQDMLNTKIFSWSNELVCVAFNSFDVVMGDWKFKCDSVRYSGPAICQYAPNISKSLPVQQSSRRATATGVDAPLSQLLFKFDK